MTNFRALVPGGYFSADPMNKKAGPVAIRYNNFGAINGDPDWVKRFPGYVGVNETTPGNQTAIFEAPEYGVALWWVLMRKYQSGGYGTLRQIILHYGGASQQTIYEGYAKDVAARTGLPLNENIDLKNDKHLLKFARAMAFQEAGKPSPLTDDQIIYGFQLGRQFDATGKVPEQNGRAPATQATPPAKGFWEMLAALLGAIFGSKKPLRLDLIYRRTLLIGDRDTEKEGGPIWQLQQRLVDLGAHDLLIDGDFGDVTEQAVKNFQSAHRIDPNGEVDQLTIEELNHAQPNSPKPTLNPPSLVKYGEPPPWYNRAEKDIGFHEQGVNLGIDRFIDGAKSGTRAQLRGQPWCATGANYWLESSGVPGSKSAMARSFETSPNFIKLKGPALGAIATMWRGSKQSGSGHVYFYDGENERGIRGIGANENDQVQRSFHDRGRTIDYFWPKGYPLPDRIGPIIVNDAGVATGSET